VAGLKAQLAIESAAVVVELGSGSLSTCFGYPHIYRTAEPVKFEPEPVKGDGTGLCSKPRGALFDHRCATMFEIP
jgi:hypothetical protein